MEELIWGHCGLSFPSGLPCYLPMLAVLKEVYKGNSFRPGCVVWVLDLPPAHEVKHGAGINKSLNVIKKKQLSL